jgi:hypothetical protein
MAHSQRCKFGWLSKKGDGRNSVSTNASLHQGARHSVQRVRGVALESDLVLLLHLQGSITRSYRHNDMYNDNLCLKGSKLIIDICVVIRTIQYLMTCYASWLSAQAKSRQRHSWLVCRLTCCILLFGSTASGKLYTRKFDSLKCIIWSTRAKSARNFKKGWLFGEKKASWRNFLVIINWKMHITKSDNVLWSNASPLHPTYRNTRNERSFPSSQCRISSRLMWSTITQIEANG